VPHDIFLDHHFRSYHRLVSLRYVPASGPMVPLPLLDEQGQPGPYCSGRIWTKWVYRTTGPEADSQKLAAGLKSFAAFWAAQQQLPLERARFQVVVKKVAVPRTWQRDHLRRQMRQPWQPAATLRWQSRRQEEARQEKQQNICAFLAGTP
jgi:hypothetical protein